MKLTKSKLQQIIRETLQLDEAYGDLATSDEQQELIKKKFTELLKELWGAQFGGIEGIEVDDFDRALVEFMKPWGGFEKVFEAVQAFDKHYREFSDNRAGF